MRLVSLVSTLFFALAVGACSAAPEPSASQTPKIEYSEEGLRQALAGKTKDGVIGLLGAPDIASDGAAGMRLLSYDLSETSIVGNPHPFRVHDESLRGNALHAAVWIDSYGNFDHVDF